MLALEVYISLLAVLGSIVFLYWLCELNFKSRKRPRSSKAAEEIRSEVSTCSSLDVEVTSSGKGNKLDKDSRSHSHQSYTHSPTLRKRKVEKRRNSLDHNKQITTMELKIEKYENQLQQYHEETVVKEDIPQLALNDDSNNSQDLTPEATAPGLSMVMNPDSDDTQTTSSSSVESDFEVSNRVDYIPPDTTTIFTEDPPPSYENCCGSNSQ